MEEKKHWLKSLVAFLRSKEDNQEKDEEETTLKFRRLLSVKDPVQVGVGDQGLPRNHLGYHLPPKLKQANGLFEWLEGNQSFDRLLNKFMSELKSRKGGKGFSIVFACHANPTRSCRQSHQPD